MPFEQVKAILEALLFASDAPLSPDKLGSVLPDTDTETIRQAVDALNAEYERNGRVFRIVAVAGGLQMASLPEYAEWIRRLQGEGAPAKLSGPALETLAIVAYKQPVIRPEIEAIRGVNADWVLRVLMDRGLIRMVGRSNAAGRPLLYGTTKEFLKYFGLSSLSDLPKPGELKLLLSEKQDALESEAESVSGAVGSRVASEGG